MKKAFAIACWRPKLDHLIQAATCASSIRYNGRTEDIIILTVDKDAVIPLERSCSRYGAEVRLFDQLFLHDRAWVRDRRNSHYSSLLDPNKHYYWSLTEYDSVIGLDCDCWVYRDTDCLFEIDKFNVWNGADTGPVCSAMMTVKPSQQTFEEMRHLLCNSEFSFETGWNNCGSEIKGLEGYEGIGWDLEGFQSADSFQGFLVYYFHILKGIFNTAYQRIGGHCIGHAGGYKKSDWYSYVLKKYSGGLATLL